MANSQAVLYSFSLYVLYVLLPLIPAILIFRLFPETKVTVSGPLQNLTVNATGAFAAYVVTVALGFFLVKNVETQIALSRQYAFEGVISDLGANQFINSDRFYSRNIIAAVDSSAGLQTRDYYFVLLLDHPVEKPETVLLNYWQLNAAGGTGAVPASTPVPIELGATSSSPQRFRLLKQNNQFVVEPESQVLGKTVSN